MKYGEVRPKLGDRVEIHPRMDLWMRGAKYGCVVGVKHYEEYPDVYTVTLDKVKESVQCKQDDLKLIHTEPVPSCI